jgi:tRNA-splicing ligase RtcB
MAEDARGGQELHFCGKGAIRAGLGDMGIIPGSMGASSFIVRGLGNGAAYESASHGAGRKMSRSAARKRFTVEDLIAQTEGVECRKDPGVIDEIPGAYKDIEEVMAAQSDLVEIAVRLRQVICVKG